MTGLRPIIDSAVASAIAEHPKYFTERGIEKAQSAITRKIMAALFRSDGDKPAEPQLGETADPVPLAADPKSREGRAYASLRMLGGASPPLWMSNGTISIPTSAQRDSVYALAALPAQAAWEFITDHRQVGAWQEFFAETMPTAARRPIQTERNGQTGILMPWPWPPAKDGKIYSRDETLST